MRFKPTIGPAARTHAFCIGAIHAYVIEESSFQSTYEKEFILTEGRKEEYGHQILEVGFNYLLLHVNNSWVLVDTGRGNGNLVEGLKQLGKSVEDIDFIILTHSDGDHVGGLKEFPNATMVIPRELKSLWSNEKEQKVLIEEFSNTPFVQMMPAQKKEAMLSNKQSFFNWFKTLKNDQTLFFNEQEIFLETIQFFKAPGHRGDHYGLTIFSEEECLIHCSDAIRNPIQLKQHSLVSKYDSSPDLLIPTLKQIYDRAKEQKATFFCTHYSFPGLF